MQILSSGNDRYLVYCQFSINKYHKDKDILCEKFNKFILLNDQDNFGNVHNVFFCEKLIIVEFEDIIETIEE